MRRESATRDCDLIVIGAGPAGALAARHAALHGLQTLLVDAKPFPREKVCGGCLNLRALQTLRQVGLGHILESGVPIHSLRLRSGSQCLDLPLPHGLALSRKTLDQSLVHEAVTSGVTFLDETSATVQPEPDPQCRRVTLTHRGKNSSLRARAVLVADGLLRSSLRNFPQFASRISPYSHLGAGANLHEDSSFFPPGCITMAVGKAGYVGLTRLENGELNLAAALNPSAVKQSHSLNVLAATILRRAGLPLPQSIDSVPWQGTPLLTSRPGLQAAERIFLIGDAAGYVEPFTGEGIAAALESALAVLPFLQQTVRNWQPHLMTAWTGEYQQNFRKRQWICRTLSPLLRNQAAVTLLMQSCRLFPAIPRFFIRKINHPGFLSGSISQGCL